MATWTEPPDTRSVILAQLLAALEAEQFGRSARRRPGATTSTQARQRVAYLDDHPQPTP